MSELRESVSFEAEERSRDGFGGSDVSWVVMHTCRAAFRYQHGKEAVQAGAVTGSAVFKVKIRSCDAARKITPAVRMKDLRRNTVYNIREVDAVTDSRWVWIGAESGVAI